MKRFLLFFLLLTAYASQGMAQSEAMYVWRNDGDFNAFLKADIDSIGYSHLDKDSVYHNEWQMQVVYTKDATYRIPLAAIDSVSFRAPETVVNKDVFQLTSAHDPYLSLCDTIRFTLSSSTPAKMRPSVGNVVVSTYDCQSFADGIMARVREKREDTSGIHYECEKVGIDEVYDQLVMVGTCYAEDENPANSASLKPKDIEVIVDKTAWDKSWKKTFEKGGTTTNLDVNDNAHIILTLRIQKGKQPYFRLDLVNELKSSITFNASSSYEQWFEKSFFNQTLGRILIPGAPLLYITPKLSLSAYFAEGGEVSLDYTGHCNRTDKISFICQNNKWTVYHTPKTDVGVDVASLSMKGYAEVGLIPDMLFSLNGSATGIGVEYSVGIKETIDFKFDAVSYFDEGMYAALKDSYARTTIPQDISLYASIGLWGDGVQPYRYTHHLEPQWGTDKYILPLFSKPTYSQGTTASKANFKSTISRSLLFPVEVGMAYYEDDTRLQTKYLTPKYQSPASWNLNGLESTFDNVESGKTYTAYPVVRLMGKTLRATPSTTFPERHACPDSHHPHAIDLGLPSGTKWACCNVGAKSPEEYGGYYAWGETSEKSEYTWENYAYYNSSTNNFVNIGSNIAETVYDVAHVRMGGSWRMPTLEQQRELTNHCIRQLVKQNDTWGMLLIGTNDAQIFFPNAGFRHNDELDCNEKLGGGYWSSTLDSSYKGAACSINFFLDWDWDTKSKYRNFGFTVRAVCP